MSNTDNVGEFDMKKRITFTVIFSKTPIPPEFFEQILSSKENATVIEKLSKMTVWLCNQALDEYDFKEGESYVVICRSASVPYQSVSVFLTITEQGRFFKWWAFVEKEQ